MSSWIPHISFILAQVYLGFFVILVIGSPVYMLATAEDGPSWGEHLASFVTWTRALIKLAPKGLALLLFACFPVGFLSSECAYRIGRICDEEEGG